MRDRLEDLGAHTTVALVTFTDANSLATYTAQHELGFVALRDPDRTGYRAFGLTRGTLARVWGWRALRRYAELLRADGPRDLHRPIEDTRQLGGDFVIDADGLLQWGFWGQGPDDRPSVDELVAAVEVTRR